MPRTVSRVPAQQYQLELCGRGSSTASKPVSSAKGTPSLPSASVELEGELGHGDVVSPEAYNGHRIHSFCE